MAEQIDQPAEDATLQPEGDTLVSRPGQAGLTVDRGPLRRAIVRRLVSPAGSDRVKVPVRHVAPDVTEADLSTQYPSYIMVDRATFELRLFKNLKLTRTYPIAVGQQGLETPAGLYDIQDKQVDPTWHVPESDWAGDLAGKSIPPGPDNPLKARWMGFNGGAGIHGTAEVGLAWQRRLARLHPNGRGRRRGPLRPGHRRHPGLYPLTARSLGESGLDADFGRG